MTYLPQGAIEATAFVNKSGICKPRDFATLYIFQEMQHQLDRVAQGKSLPKIAPDGDIGPATVSLVMKTGPYNAMMAQAATCDSVAAHADSILTEAKAKADALGVPDKVTTPVIVKAPAIISATGGSVVAPPNPVGAGASVMDSVKSLGTVGVLAIGAGVVVIGYVLTKKKKGK